MQAEDYRIHLERLFELTTGFAQIVGGERGKILYNMFTQLSMNFIAAVQHDELKYRGK